MKRVTLKILDSSLKQVIGGEFTVCLKDDANVLDLINEVDASRKKGFFLKDYPEYRSLLHMTWNPVKKRFYKQIALSAYAQNNEFFEVRKNPAIVLPDGLTVFLGLGLCKSEHEEIVDFEAFQKTIRDKSTRRLV
jgi:hypothetical protein